MGSPGSTIPPAGGAWRYACLGLGALLVLSWGYFSSVALRREIMLTECRVTNENLWRDLTVLGEAARGRVSREALLRAQALLEPKPARVVGHAIHLRALQVEFDEDALLLAIVEQ